MPRILSLDDKSEILTLLHSILERAGYEHIYTTDNEEALHILRNEQIDLFTQNINPSNIEGCRLYNTLCDDSALQHIPILMITTHDPLAFIDECATMILDLYPNNYLFMPFSRKQLLRAVARALESRKG